MSNVRELALLEKWTIDSTRNGVATNNLSNLPTYPELSPTSPKATKFCCCPNRRRYTVKQTKPSTLHARNIFLDSKYTYNNSNRYDDDDGDDHNDSHGDTVDSHQCKSNSTSSTTSPNSNNNNNRSTNNHKSNADDADDDDEVDSVLTRLLPAKSERRRGGGVEVVVKSETRSEAIEAVKGTLEGNCSDYDDVAVDIIVGNGGDDDVIAIEREVQGRQGDGKCPLRNQSRESNNNNNSRNPDDCNANQQPTTVIDEGEIISETTTKTKDKIGNVATLIHQLQQQQSLQKEKKRRLNGVISDDCSDQELPQPIQRLDNHSDNSKRIACQNSSNNNNDISQCENCLLRTAQRAQRAQRENSDSVDDDNDDDDDNGDNCRLHNIRCNYCQLDERQATTAAATATTTTKNNNNNSEYNDSTDKMTITTTTSANVANLKRGDECGSNGVGTTTTTTTATAMTGAAVPTTTTATTTSATTPNQSVNKEKVTITPNATLSPMQHQPQNQPQSRPSTPVKTVIKTILVKRSPSPNESTITTTTTRNKGTLSGVRANSTPTATTMATNGETIRERSPSGTTQLSVKERIAALVAGNDQPSKTHDISIKYKTECNSSSNSNVANRQVKSAISNFQAASGSSSGPSATPALATERSPEKHCNDSIPPLSLQACRSSPPSPASLLASSNTGCPTMPRRRQHGLAMKDRSISLDDAGSTVATAMTATNDPAATMKSDRTAAISLANRKLAALDNLDLASSLELKDDEDEDPYCELQEYLERVKQEINEVFESHKARQRMQQLQQEQQQEEQQQQQQLPLLEDGQQPEPATTTDELSRSTESDSGFDSASGGHIGGRYKLPTKASPTAANVKSNNEGATDPQASASSSRSDVSGHALIATAAAGNVKTTTPATITKLRPWPPPPLSPTKPAHNGTSREAEVNGNESSRSPAALRSLRKKSQSDAENAEDVDIWANKFLRDLNDLMASDKQSPPAPPATPTTPVTPSMASSMVTAAATTSSSSANPSPTAKTSPTLLSASASRDGNHGPERVKATILPRPEKHATIPLQSFNLDCGRRDVNIQQSTAMASQPPPTTTTAKTNIAYFRTLSAPAADQQQQQQQQQQKQNIDNNSCCMASGKRNHRNSLAAFSAGNTADTLSKATTTTTTTTMRDHNLLLTNLQGNETTDAAAIVSSTVPSASMTILKIEETAPATSGQRQPLHSVKTSKLTAAAAGDCDYGGDGSGCGERREGADEGGGGGDEDDASLKARQQRQLVNDMEAIRSALLRQSQELEAMVNSSNCGGSGSGSSSVSIGSDKNHHSPMVVASSTPVVGMATTTIPKRERINHATTTTTATSTPLTASMLTSSTLKTSSNVGGNASTTAPANGNLLNGSDATKKGSTSTIWTSEESILRSVGAVDEDNNSTSSSACEEASGVLSSGKSGISLDSSGLDNDNNESGIGTATPPKDHPYWKTGSTHNNSNNNDNESVSSLDALRKMKFQKSSSVASSDDPDLLEVLSMCGDEMRGGDDDLADDDDGDESQRKLKQKHQRQLQRQSRLRQQSQQQQQQQQPHRLRQHQNGQAGNGSGDGNHDDSIEAGVEMDEIEAADNDHDAADEHDDDVDVDENDEGHDEFESVPYCDCECATDGDASSASGSGSGPTNGGPIKSLTSNSNSGVGGGCGSGGNRNGLILASLGDGSESVVLRRRYHAAPIMVPYGGPSQKNRSHSLDTSSLPSSYTHCPHPSSPLYHHHQHPNTQHHHLYQHYHPHGHALYHYGHSPVTCKLHHLANRNMNNNTNNSNNRDRGQLSLALRQEPFQSLMAPLTHFHELPSPSSASLHSGHESLGIQELTTKSNSAPLLLKQEKTRRDDFAAQNVTLRYSRSQSDRYLAEIEAVEACKWLRAAGFPQYAQMYEDHQFPIDLTNVAKDHTNLENDQLQSLYRRLCILNRCANMRLDQSHKTQTPQKEDSDDENFALSENWTFQPHIRRWSRIGEMGLELPPGTKLNVDKTTESSSKESSPDRFEDDAYDVAGTGLSLLLPGAAAIGGAGGGDSTDTTLNDSADANAVRLRRTGSERLKDGAKALLRRVESIKSRRRKRQNREGIVISGTQALDLTQLGQRSSLRKPDAVYSTPPSPSAVSPMHTFPKSPFYSNELKVPSQSENFLSPHRASPKRTPTTPRSMRTSPLHFFSTPMPHLREGKSDDSSSYCSDSQESTAGSKTALRKVPSKTRRFLQRSGKVDDIGAHSDSECHQGRKLLIKDANSNTTEVKVKKLTRGGSLNLGKDPKKREGFRTASFRSRSTTRKDNKEETEQMKKTPVVRWHSFQMEERPHMIFRKCLQKLDSNSTDYGIPFVAMSAGQLQIIRKLALVVLTGYMERYCPTHRSGWNWELPKFIKKIKMPDYKDKRVFGVPLLLILQRTGQTLPPAVRSAFRWLQLNALDQTGLFRKSGVKSRILKLKEMIECSESSAECMDIYDTQQAFDVADMLKQYFRDLPESLLTTKMSETFAAIFQHLPAEVRLDAIQCAVLLLPDENRETLYALLEFLTLVADNAGQNQMTANNLAVCLAPSLFHTSISTGLASVTASPRRRKGGSGVPDAKELSEAKASHECLTFMIENYRQIFTASKEKISKCNFGYMEESKPVPLEALGEGMQFHNWRGYLYECTSATIKEGREKTRGWFSVTPLNDSNIDIAYKKVGDGHPLRLWRCITEVEGPPKDVMEYIIKQRASWDQNLLQSQTVKKLDEHTEIFQYAIDGQVTTDFCVLRSWQTDLPRGACVIVETSIDHSKARPMFGAVRGVVLASRYLIEPCGSGRSRVMHLARVDTKGRTPEWYNKSYGHICSHYLSRIRLAFKNVAEGPESKV